MRENVLQLTRAANAKIAGPIVRINPNELHINDVDFVDTLYAVGVKRDKDPRNSQIFGTPLSCKPSHD